MLVPVRCFTCGCSVGHVSAVYALARRRLVEAKLAERGTAPSQSMVDTGLQIECGEILDRLAIVHLCCRKTLIAAMNFQDYY